jgi:TonB family protein
MAPIVKDVENSAATTAPAAPATKPPQPVALEVPVTVNGARTVDGSDKREPFSESTKTVLIFGHGAVIRLASLVAPGQLLFVTNEKTKKEVVCQVVKSKNYRTVTGYVELEFTEPAIGFWGMRFPTDRVSPVVAHAPAQHPAASAPSAVPAPPKTVAAPPVPAAMKPAAGAPVPVKPVAVAPPVAPPLAKPAPPKPQQPVASHPASPIASHPAPSAPPSPAVPAYTVAPKPPVPIKPEPIHVPEAIRVPVTPAASTSQNIETKSAVPQPPTTIPTIPSANPTTDELKQHAARLQEQLSSMLFTEAPSAKHSAPEKPAAPRPDMIPTETVQKILQLAQSDVKPPSPPVTPLQETRPTSTVKSVPVSMAVEEVKIPAWLAPLARETDTNPADTTVEGAAIAEANSSSAPAQQESLSLDAEAVSAKVEHPMFGDQLLGTTSEVAATSSSGGSKKGLFIGLAAAGLLLIGGGAWYAKQPGNALSGLFAPKPAATQTHTAQNSTETTSKPAFRAETATAGGPTGTSLNPSATPKPLTPAPVSASNSAGNSSAVPAVVKETTSAPRNAAAAPVEQPKKPALGEVHLATPSVNRAADSAQGGEAAPSIDAGQPAVDEPVTLADSHSKEPSAPLPIGGDVVPAKLLKSVPPVYPPAARSQRVGGDVKIDALIDVAGNVSTMKIISGPTLLHQAAMNAVKQWKYEPAKLDGNPTPMHLTVIVQFRLQ